MFDRVLNTPLLQIISLKNYTAVLLIHHRIVIFPVPYMNLSPCFSVVIAWVAYPFLFKLYHFTQQRQDLTRWSFRRVSFIVVIVVSIVADSLLYLYKSIIQSSLHCCWYFQSGAPNRNLFVLDKLWDCQSTLDFFCLY